MKQYHDMIYRRIPAAWAHRLTILQDVSARAAELATWNARKQAADGLWAQWRPSYERAERGEAADYPARSMLGDREAMEAHFNAFAAVSELLIDNGLVALKKELAHEHYVTVDIPGCQAAYAAAPDEDLTAFKARMRGVVNAYVQPGAAAWKVAAGYNFPPDPHIRQLAQIGGYDAHWTVYSNQLGNLVNLRTDDPIANIVAALVPNGNGLLGVHVTLEVLGANNAHNPRAFGRPASRHANAAQLPNGVQLAQLDASLNAENTRLENRISDWVTERNDRVVAGWQAH